MKPVALLACLILPSLASAAAPSPARIVEIGDLTASAAPAAAAAVDTTWLLGGPGVLTGKFQDAAGLPDRQGWTGVDLSAPAESRWRTSTYRAAALDPATPGNHAWWCGDVFTSCDPGDDPEGYGNSWYEKLEWTGTVPDPGREVTVRVRAVLNYDVEPAYDYLFLHRLTAASYVGLFTRTGTGDAVHLDVSFSLTPSDYLGEGSDEVRLRWLFSSDGAWSDADCYWPTHGAAQVDSIAVTFDQGDGPFLVGTVETCEPGDPLQWTPAPVQGAGDFSQVWPLLDDLDPDQDNDTPQFAFIDDGVVVPGTGGSPCVTWCYGPDGWIVNPGTGVSDLNVGIDNEIWSPVLDVPEGEFAGALLSYDVYVHDEITSGGAAISPVWGVRSTADPAGVDGWSEWRNDLVLTWGPPTYARMRQSLTGLLVPGFRHLQVALGARKWMTGGVDGTPAPYFDNVAVTVYPRPGGSVLRVSPDGSGDFPTIAAAIAAAASGDTILLADGVFSGDGNRDLSPQGKLLTIASESGDPQTCAIDCGGSASAYHRGFSFKYGEDARMLLRGVAVRNGYTGGAGGAVALDGTAPAFVDCVFENNRVADSMTHGGAVACQDASPTFTGCSFRSNTGGWGGAIAARGDSHPIATDCLFVANKAISGGAGVLARDAGCTATIVGCTFDAHWDQLGQGTLTSQFEAAITVERSILASAVLGYATWCHIGGTVDVACSDIYGNAAGDWTGCVSDQLGQGGNICADPIFCGEQWPDAPYSLHALSPCAAGACGTMGAFGVACSGPTAADGDVPAAARLVSAAPNPFNPAVVVRFELAERGRARLAVYDLLGRRVRTLLDETRDPGTHALRWDGRDDAGRALAGGAYFCRLTAGGAISCLKLTLLK